MSRPDDMQFASSEREQGRLIANLTVYERLLLHESLLETAVALAGPQALLRPRHHPDHPDHQGASSVFRHLDEAC